MRVKKIYPTQNRCYFASYAVKHFQTMCSIKQALFQSKQISVLLFCTMGQQKFDKKFVTEPWVNWGEPKVFP
jgi:hypothetical protein